MLVLMGVGIIVSFVASLHVLACMDLDLVRIVVVVLALLTVVVSDRGVLPLIDSPCCWIRSSKLTNELFKYRQAGSEY